MEFYGCGNSSTSSGFEILVFEGKRKEAVSTVQIESTDFVSYIRQLLPTTKECVRLGLPLSQPSLISLEGKNAM